MQKVEFEQNCRKTSYVWLVFFPPPLPSQGDKADSFYIVESGEVKILIKSKVSSDMPVVKYNKWWLANDRGKMVWEGDRK